MRFVTLRWIFLAMVILPASGCSGIGKNYSQTGKFDVPLTYTTADTRIVMERINPVTHQIVVCTEPGPDANVVFANGANGSAQGGDAAITAGLSFGVTSSEAAAEMAGRSTALLGLRDGLYRACEAYANGVIGADAYALVLARYGQLMTTLFLGQDVTGAAGVGTAEAINATAQAGTPATPNASDTPAPGKKAASPGNAAFRPRDISAPKLILADAGPADIVPSVIGSAASLDTLEPRIMDAQMTVASLGASPGANAGGGANPAGGAAAAAPNKDAPAAPKATQPGGNNSDGDTTPKTSSPATAAAGVSATSALVLGRMNEDYFALDEDDTHLLLTACLNEMDPTRIHAMVPLVEGGTAVLQADGSTSLLQGGTVVTDAKGNIVRVPAYNTALLGICNDLNKLEKIQTATGTDLKNEGYPKPIDPGTVAASSTQPNAKNK